MYNDLAEIMMLHTLTSTHPGSGTELSYVDMPIQREGHTGYPKIEAATLKGCLRHSISRRKVTDEKLVNKIFGMPDSGDFASALSITDARLLFFPVKSVKGVFGWITCPMVLERFVQDYRLVYGKSFLLDEWKAEVDSVYSEKCKLAQKGDCGCVIMLEDYTYMVKENPNFAAFLEALAEHLPKSIGGMDSFKERAVVLDDNDFADFVKYSTEVNTRIRINAATGTVADNALFTEEYLPPECVLYNLVFFTDPYEAQKEESLGGLCRTEIKKEFKELIEEGIIQVGANSGLGKGLVQMKMWEGRDGQGCS